MNTGLIFAAGVLEMSTMYFIMTAVDPVNRLHPAKLLICLAAAGAGVAFADAADIPYQTCMLLMMEAILFFIMTRNKILEIITDLFLSAVIYAVMQLGVTAALSPVCGDIVDHPPVLFAFLVFFTVLSSTAARFQWMNGFFERYYRRNRRIVLWIAVSLLFFIAIVINLWNDDNDIFWDKYRFLIILTGLYCFVNGAFIVSLFKIIKKNDQIKLIKNYGDYLRNVTEELKQREHEFKNNINTMIALAEKHKDDPGSGEIVDFGREMLSNEKAKGKISIISDNSVVSALIYKMKKDAEKEGIDFFYRVEKPFPEFDMPEHDIVEILANLLNNAFEAVSELKKGKRNVSLEIEKDHICVINDVDENVNVSKIRNRGYSTKGTDRGYGVSNVAALLKKNKAGMDIFLEGESIIFDIRFNR